MTRCVLVCGGRDFADRQRVFNVLDTLHMAAPISEVVEGGAKGADALARAWCQVHRIDSTIFLADWSLGLKAGPVRNQRMLDEGKPTLVVVFPGGRGTADMKRRAKAAGVPVLEVNL